MSRSNARRFAIGFLGAALLALGAAFSPATMAAASADDSDAMWGVNTGGQYNPPRDNFVLAAEPGETLDDSMLVTNHGAEPLTLTAYAADAFTTESGQLDVLTPDKTSVGVGAWVRIDESTITLDPQETLEVPFTVTVPENAEPGDYAGAVVTSLSSQASSGLSVDRRLGIRIYLQVGGELAPVIVIDHLSLDYTGTANPFAAGSATATATIRNEGNARLNAGWTVTVAGPLGWWTTEASADVPQLLPGESWDVKVEVPDTVPAVLLTASATLAPALADGQPIAAVVAETTTWAVPWALIALIVALGAIIWAAVVALRRRRRRRKQAEDARVEQAVQEALQERGLAEETVISGSKGA